MKKNFLKTVSALVLTFALTFTLIACKPKADVHVFIYNYADTYIGGVRAELATQLKDANVAAQFHDANGSQDTQNTQIDNAITAGAKLLIVNIFEVGSGDVVAKKAKDAGIPIIFFNREVEDVVIRGYEEAVYVGTDPDAAGYMQGELVAEELLKNPTKWDKNGDGKFNYVMLRAGLDEPEGNGRTQYSIEEANRILTEAGKEELVALSEDQVADWDTAKAKTAMAALIEANPFTGANPIEVVFANNDDMAIGAVEALIDAGYNKDDAEKQVLVVGVDATAPAMDYINNGGMFGTIKQDGVAMATAIREFAVNKLAGKDYNAGTNYKYTPSLIDGEAVDKLRIDYSKVTK